MLEDHLLILDLEIEYAFVVFKNNGIFGTSRILKCSDTTENIRPYFSLENESPGKCCRVVSRVGIKPGRM